MEKVFKVNGIAASKGAKAAIESAGGSVTAPAPVVEPPKKLAKKQQQPQAKA